MISVLLTTPILFGFLGWIGMQEMMIIGVVAILLFGKNLPGVARNLGKTYNDFKRGLSEVQSEFSKATRDVEDTFSERNLSGGGGSGGYQPAASDYDDFEEATAPKFEPPPSEPPQNSQSPTT
ncbi:MAG: twin-arginine translocase TatA/TatE family subunit [Pirellulaceae bacterium]